MWRRFWTWVRWVWRGSHPVTTYHFSVQHPAPTALIDAAVLTPRLSPLRASTQYRVVLSLMNEETSVYCGPTGAHARQVYETLKPRAGETVTFWDGEDCRGTKVAP